MDITEIGRRLRKVPNLTQFARESGVSRRTLNRMRNGWNNPTFETLRKIELQLVKDKQ